MKYKITYIVDGGGGRRGDHAVANILRAAHQIEDYLLEFLQTEAGPGLNIVEDDTKVEEMDEHAVWTPADHRARSDQLRKDFP